MNRILTAAAILGLATAAPAFAARESACAAAPQIRSAAASAQPAQAERALRAVATAEKLCEAGNDRAAKDKIEVAMRALGTAQAPVAAAPTAGQ